MDALTPEKYLSKVELHQLRQTVEDKAIVDIAKGRMTWDKMWMMIDLVTSTGMRVAELTGVQLHDCHLGRQPYIHVVGKRNRERDILIGSELVKHIKAFSIRYRLQDSDYLLNTNGRQYTTMGLQRQFKRSVKEADLPEHYSIHAARHTYATYLYEQQRDLRMVQKQLGHANINTTQIYADATKERTYEAVNELYKE